MATQKNHRINHRIKADPIFLIDHEQNIHNSISLEDALRLAKEAELDLVEVNPTSTPPVCKIIDYGQFQYQQSRNVQEAKQKSRKVEVKGIRLSFKIGKGDIITRQKQATKFLDKGNKVRIELMLRGRERQHAELAIQIVRDFIAALGDKIKMEQSVKYKGNTISALISK